MKIEFKKIPTVEKTFELEIDSVKIEGTFCRMSPSLAKIRSKIVGKLQVDCCKCGKEFDTDLDEEMNIIVSNGIFESDRDFEEDIIEISDEIIDFDEIINSELESIKSDYHLCDDCLDDEGEVEYKF